MTQKILTKNFDIPGSEKLDTYLKSGGYRTLPKALGMKPEQVPGVPFYFLFKRFYETFYRGERSP